MTGVRSTLVALAVAGASAAAGQVDQNTMRVHFIDVSQGAAALLEFSCGVVMIDAGGRNAATTAGLVAYLRAFMTSRRELRDTIRTVFISHNHADHDRALRAVLEDFTVRRVIENGQRSPLKPNRVDEGDAPLIWAETFARTHPDFTLRDVDQVEVNQTAEGLADGDIDPVDCPGTDPDIRLLSADREEDDVDWPTRVFENKNNHSLVIRVSFGEASFLFTGDLEGRAIASLLEAYGSDEGGVLDVDVYHAGHHGAENGTTPDLLSALVRPRLAIISMGPCDERGVGTAAGHGHPREGTIRLLRQAVVPLRPASRQVHVARAQRRFTRTTMRDAIYATGWDGTIVVTATAAGTYTVTTTGRPVPTC